MAPSSFRQRYLNHAELTAQLQAWAKAHPDVARLASIGKSREGRDIWALTIGRHPDVAKPAVWVDGNMHASELCGSSAALAIAEDVLKIHKGEPLAFELPQHQREFLKDVLFHVVPRISPDGAEHVLKVGRYLRSSPADSRPNQGHAHWKSGDIDGDGQCMQMRIMRDDGELVESKQYPGVMIPRSPDDDGPFYKVFPEGTIENFDGHKIPSPGFYSDNELDFNRNFPFSWAPEPEQAGAGNYPGSAPETRAIMDFVSAHPNLMVWTNFHTFGGVFIRPGGDRPDHKLDQGDLAVYRQLEQWATQYTGYPTVSGFHEFLYEPEKPLRGDLTEYAHRQRGCLAWVCELWDVFRQIGIERKKPFIDHYTHFDRAHYEALAKWDQEHNKGRIFRPWRPCKHPQLGDVELGGLDLRVGISNPPYEKIDEVCNAQSAVFLRMAALLPRVELTIIASEKVSDGLTRIDAVVRNTGYLGTYGIPSAKALPLSEPLRLRVTGGHVVAPAEAVLEIGHLDGWGQGLYHGRSIFLPYTRGTVSERHVSLVVEAAGPVELVLESCRVGKTTAKV